MNRMTKNEQTETEELRVQSKEKQNTEEGDENVEGEKRNDEDQTACAEDDDPVISSVPSFSIFGPETQEKFQEEQVENGSDRIVFEMRKEPEKQGTVEQGHKDSG
ncbi:unnamed protein product, partial [Cuscuta europaea]